MTDDSNGVCVRKLQSDDFGKGFLQLLSQLTTVGDISKEQFEGGPAIDREGVHALYKGCAGRYAELTSSPDYHIAVAEDVPSGQLLGTAALIVERKFIHNCGKVGHIEDVVVDAAARGKNLGKRLIDALIDVAQQQGCYKVILDCSEANQPFYEKCGLIRKEVQMVKYLDR